MSGPESKIEKYLKDELEKYGFKVVKFVPQGFAGAPDRWVFAPKWSPAPPVCIEVKAEGKTPRKLQIEAMADLSARGVKVYPYVDSKAQVDELVTNMVYRAYWRLNYQERLKLPIHIREAVAIK